MEQIEIIFHVPEDNEIISELLPYWLEPLGFEGFLDGQGVLMAYISTGIYDREALLGVLKEHEIPAESFTETRLPYKNWNQEWERNFEPVLIGKKCYIRAPFHPSDPAYPMEIIIEPKMSFGTGHHATTSLMVNEMLSFDMKGKSVLDAGCGTGILSILAEKLGAYSVSAIDIDEWSYHNALENINKNKCSKISVFYGDISNFSGSTYDLIVANINLHILILGLSNYRKLLRPNGYLFMSGILSSDIDALKNETEKLDFSFENYVTLNNWAVVRFRKK